MRGASRGTGPRATVKNAAIAPTLTAATNAREGQALALR